MRSNRIGRFILLPPVVFILTALPVPLCATQGPTRGGDVTIYRDNYGVPHIYAKDTYSLFYGYGYALATDRLFQMEMSKRTVLGTAAEVLGKEYIDFDKSVRSSTEPASIKRQYATLPQADRDVFDGYAAGMNARIDQIKADPQLLPREYIDFGFAPSPWSPIDVIMIFVGTMANRYCDFNTEVNNLSLLQHLIASKGAETGWAIFNQLKWQNDPDAPTTVPTERRLALPEPEARPVPATAQAAGKNVADLLAAGVEWQNRETALLSRMGLGMLSEPSYRSAPFSNIWIVGRKKATGGGSILLNGPQFRDFVPGYVFEAGLHGGGFDVVGSTPFGYPALLFGHNRHIAWGGTAGVGDQIDMYQEELNPSNRFQYRFNNRWLEMERRTDTILVKDQPSATVDIYRTVHGFVTQFDPANNRAFAKKRAWEGFEVQSLVAWIESTRAKNHGQWLKAASKYGLTINWYYADRQGNIGYAHAGMYPLRKSDHDPRLPAPGTGEMEWIGIRPFSQNPQVYNPGQGFIANWNNKPANSWNGPDLAFWSWGSADRVQLIIDGIREKEKFSPQEMWDLNKRIAFLDQNLRYFLPFLKEAAKGGPGPRESQAVSLLANWDARRVDGDSNGQYDNPAQVILDKWLEVMLKGTLQDDLGAFYTAYTGLGAMGPGEVSVGGKILYHCLLGEKSSVRNKYDFFNGVPAAQVTLASLTQALAELESSYGTANMTEWKAATVPHVFSPVNFAGLPQTNPDRNLTLPLWMNRGTQNDMIVLRPAGIRGVNVCPPGQSGFVAPNNEKSPHYSDQMQMYRDFESKRMLFELSDVKARSESVIHLRTE